MNFDTEPTLGKIDDYDNNESKEKRRNVRLIVLAILAIGLAYSFAMINSQQSLLVSNEESNNSKTD